MENSINQRVQLLIDAVHKTTNAFAKSIGRTSTSVVHVTSGRSKPGYEVLEAICQAYPNLNRSWLLMGEGEMFVSETSKQVETDNRPDAYLQDQIKKLEENFSRLANQLDVKDGQIQNLSEMLKMTLGKSDLGEETPCFVLNSLAIEKRA
jgi:transcriptional regulator with XRE-family HTH domain